MQVDFKEVQRITQWWLWLVLLLIGMIPIWGIYQQLIKGVPFGSKPMSDAGLILLALLTFGVIALFFLIKLKTLINNKGIQMHFIPFVKKELSWAEIKTTEVVNYGFVGGWGIRLGTKYGTVYNVKGNKGLAIELKNGKKLLIGTQKEIELRDVLEKLSVIDQ